MDLPTEIWQMIYEDIHDNRTLSRLSRTCRFLWELGIPLLYKKFETFDFNYDGRRTHYQSLSAFIRTVSNNEYLARVVTEMYAKSQSSPWSLSVSHLTYVSLISSTAVS